MVPKIKLPKRTFVAGLTAVGAMVLAATSLAVSHPIVTFKRLPSGLIQYKLPKFYGPCKKQYTVYELQAHRADAWAQSTAKQVNVYGKSHCLKVINEDAGGYQNVSKQLSQLDAAIASKPAAIMLWTTDPTAVVGDVKKALKAGIKVVNFVVPANTTADAYVAGDWRIDGGLMANAIAKKIGGKGDVLAVFGGAGGSYAAGLQAGAQKAMKAYPNIHLSVQTIPDFDPSKVTPLVQNAITSDPNLKGVITSIAVMADGAYTAIQAAGKAGKIFTAAGLIGAKQNIQDVKTGKITVMVGVPSVFYADLGVIVTANLLNGKPFPLHTVIPGQVFTASNISIPGALKWELRPEFLK